MTKEQIDAVVEIAREEPRLLHLESWETLGKVFTALADQREELAALLTQASDALFQADEIIGDDGDDFDEDEGYAPLRMEINALLARIGVTP